MFQGIFETTIDAKGRTSLPAKFREVLVEVYGDERFFVTNSNPVRLGGGLMSSGLAIYPQREFAAFREKLLSGSGLGFTSAQLDSIKRLIFAPAIETSADKLGRMLIPPHLRKRASLDREIVFVGSINKAEIWSLVEWDKVCSQDMQDFPNDTTALAELGL